MRLILEVLRYVASAKLPADEYTPVREGRSPSITIMTGEGTWGPLHKRGLTLISPWISNHMPSLVGGEITYLFPNFNGATVEV